MAEDLRWRALSNILASKAMFDLSDSMSREDVAFPGRLPDLRQARTVQIVTDISGSRQDGYEVYSLLITGRDLLHEWDEERLAVRAAYLPDNRRFSYKQLNDKIRQRALLPFLAAADRIPGLLFSVAIETQLRSIFGSSDEVAALANRFKWKPQMMERLLRLLHFQGLLLAGLSHSGQKLLWLSDQDAILATPKMSRDVEGIMSGVLNMYLSHRMGRAGFMTTAIDQNDRHHEDLAAIPDLSAGACFEQLRVGPIPATRRIPTQGRSAPTLRWLGSQAGSLAKRFLLLTAPKDGLGGVQMDWLKFDTSSPDENTPAI